MNPTFEKMYAQAIECYKSGDIQQSAQITDKLLKKNPSHINGLKLAARIFYNQKNTSQAISIYNQVLELLPFDADTWFKLGIIYQKQDTTKAIAAFRKVLLYAPKDKTVIAVAKSYLAKVLLKQESIDEAETLLDHVLKILLDQAMAINTMAQIKQHKGLLSEAHELFLKLLEIQPHSAEVHVNLGLVCRLMGRNREAQRYFEKALVLRPSWSHPYRELSALASKTNDSTAALSFLTKAIKVAPQDPENYRALQQLYIEQANYKKSVVCGKKLIQLKRDDATAYYQVGLALSHLGVTDETTKYFKKAFELKPSAEAAYGIGTSYQFKKLFDQAIFWFKRSLSVDKTYFSSTYQMIAIRMMLADWDTRVADGTLLLETLKSHLFNNNFQLSIPYLSFSALNINMEHNLKIHRFIGSNIERKVKNPSKYKFEKGHSSTLKIKIGYISPDFRAHPMGRLLRDHFIYHDRQKFEIYGYNLTSAEKEDPYHQKIKDGCDFFRDIYFDSTKEAVQKIQDDNIDILIDLGGYTNHSRTEILAHQAAPIQISYLGYPNTMGADYIQYILADEWLIPPQMEQYYHEKIIKIPHGIVGSYHDNSKNIEDRNTLGISSNSFVYASFNRIEKITPQMFTIWMEVLKEVPNSVLWISGEKLAYQNLEKEAQEMGIDKKQLIFSESVPFDQYLGRMTLADVFLDTHYYSAGATAVSAINMGLPILTVIDKSYTSRMGASVLAAANMNELICNNLEEYKNKAIQLGTEPSFYRLIKEKLKAPSELPLFDNARFVRNLEAALMKLPLGNKT